MSRAPTAPKSPAKTRARLDRAILRAMLARDPAAALARASRNPSLPASTRRALAAASPDGVRMAAILVAKLRFERLLAGSLEADAWFERDPQSFAAAFRRYHAEVMPTAFFPAAEARLFHAWEASTFEPRG